MVYRLEHLDRLVMAATWGSQGEQFVLSKHDIDSILHEVLEETDKIKGRLVQDVFSFTREKEIEVHIKNYQLAATVLLDRLYHREQQLTTTDASTKNFYQSCYKLILSLLSFIEERFSKYFDKDEKAADVYLALTKLEMRQKYSIVHPILTVLPESAVADNILERIKFFGNEQSSVVFTYRDIMFYKELVKELEDLNTWKKARGLFSNLQQVLIYLNYNDKEFINHIVNNIIKDLKSLDDMNDKIDRLLLYVKDINQLQKKPDTALFPRHPSVKTQLSNWFTEELSYLERKLSGLSVTAIQNAANSAAPKQKIICRLPVDQLGIFFRAASDLQIIVPASQKAMFEQISPWLSTPHRPVLSADSMRSKSYSPEKKDIEAVKDILMQLFRQVGKY
jgi:hypothetical protein